MKKRAFLVLGPESSGSRMVTRLFNAAGCFGPEDGNILDESIPDKPLLVWHRSFPSSGRWVDIGDMVRRLRLLGYAVQAAVTAREWFSMIESQVAAGHAKKRRRAGSDLRRAYPYIFSSLEACGVPFVVVTYESITQRPRAAIPKLLEFFKLNADGIEVIYDGNAKYYDR